MHVVDLPVAAQQTTDQCPFCAAVGEAGELAYLAILISGDKQTVRSLTGQFGLLR